MFDDSDGYDNRDFLWDINLNIEHEIMRGFGGSRLQPQLGRQLHGHRKHRGGTVELRRVLRQRAERSTPPSAGQQQCGYYDIKPQFFRPGHARVTNAKEFVGQNGNTRCRSATGTACVQRQRAACRTALRWRRCGRRPPGDDHCFTVDIPNQPRDINATDGVTTSWNGYNTSGPGACHVETAWMNNLDFRLNGSVPFKGGFTGSFIFRNTPGATQNATITVTAASITFKNGRASNTLTGPQVINLVTPNSSFGDRFNQLDLSVNKSFNIGWGRLRLAFDLYNALNANSIQNVTTTYGTTWLRPTTFLDPRLARVTTSLLF